MNYSQIIDISLPLKSGMIVYPGNPEVEINQIKDTITTWINEQKKKNLLVKNPSEDEILKKLLSLFENKVGKMYDSSKIKELEALKKAYRLQLRSYETSSSTPEQMMERFFKVSNMKEQ